MWSSWTRRSSGWATPRSSSGPVLAAGRCPWQVFQDAVQEAPRSEACPLCLPEGTSCHDDCQDLALDANLAFDQAQPQVHPILQVQEGVRGPDCPG